MHPEEQNKADISHDFIESGDWFETHLAGGSNFQVVKQHRPIPKRCQRSRCFISILSLPWTTSDGALCEASGGYRRCYRLDRKAHGNLLQIKLLFGSREIVGRSHDELMESNDDEIANSQPDSPSLTEEQVITDSQEQNSFSRLWTYEAYRLEVCLSIFLNEVSSWVLLNLCSGPYGAIKNSWIW